MFENSNKGIVREIADETMKVHRLRNIMACFAIALTAVLITIVCGAGITISKAIMTEQQMNPGPGSYGAGITGGPDVLKKVRQAEDVEWADIARPCMEGTPHNKEFAGNEVKFLGVSDTYYEHNYIELLSGAYPKNAQEVLMSDTLAEKTGRKLTPGQKLTLNLAVIENGVRMEKPMEVTISGFYDNPLRAIQGYEELYTTEDFPDIYNPELNDRNTKIFTKIDGITASTSSSIKQEKLDEVKEEAGGEGTFYIYPLDYTATYVGVAAVLLLIIACGYFLIYNIFYISVVNDIRFMGEMKTIGMTGRQIRTMLRYQVRRLGVVGIAIGILAGTLMNLTTVKILKSLDFTFARYCKTMPGILLAVPAAIIFSTVTVWISSRKALTLAGKVSPVEASRFRTSGKRKAVFAVVSFSLSGVLFCSLYTALMGYDVEYMVRRQNEADFRVFQYHAEQSMDSPYEPMDYEFATEVASLPFAEESFIYYGARDLKEETDIGFYGESAGEVKYEGDIRELVDREFEESGGEPWAILPNGNYETRVTGIPAGALNMEEENMVIYSGSIDKEKFATGDYLIYQPNDGWGKGKDYEYHALKAGDTLTVSFYNYEAEDYVDKTFTVMAVVGGKPDNYATGLNTGMNLAIPDQTFREIYGSQAEQMVSGIYLNTDGKDAKDQQETLEKMVAENFNPQVHLRSKYMDRLSEQTQKDQKTMMGLFVGLVFGFIGIANIVNTLVTNVLSRKIEFAAMQSIGMTKRQLAFTLFKDGMKLTGISFLIIAAAGVPIAKAVSVYPLSTGFVPAIYVTSLCFVLSAGLLLTVLLAISLTGVLNKKTVVERLREAE